MVFGTTGIQDSERFERWGIKLVNQLKKLDGLCIANRSGFAIGPHGTHEPGILYITFRFINSHETSHAFSDEEFRRSVISTFNGCVHEESMIGEDMCPDDKRILAEGLAIGYALKDQHQFTGEF